MQNTGSLILLWRNQKKLTQGELSKLCGVSRPNLSAIEQGARDMTVGTLRRIAAALGVRAGELVDGVNVSDEGVDLQEWGRHAIDRVARIVAGESLKASKEERQLADNLRSIMKHKTHEKNFGNPKNSKRAEDAMSLSLKMRLGPAMFEHFLKRVEKALLSKKANE